MTITKSLVKLMYKGIFLESELNLDITITFNCVFGFNLDILESFSDKTGIIFSWAVVRNKAFSTLLKNFRVLSVGDNDVNILIVYLLMKKTDLEFIVVENGEIALARLEEARLKEVSQEDYQPVLQSGNSGCIDANYGRLRGHQTHLG